MAKVATIEDARRISQFALPNISFEDATKLCRAIGPKLGQFQESLLADMVCRFAKIDKERSDVS